MCEAHCSPLLLLTDCSHPPPLSPYHPLPLAQVWVVPRSKTGQVNSVLPCECLLLTSDLRHIHIPRSFAPLRSYPGHRMLPNHQTVSHSLPCHAVYVDNKVPLSKSLESLLCGLSFVSVFLTSVKMTPPARKP